MSEQQEPDVELEDDEVGVCIECHSDQPMQYMMKQVSMRWEGPGDYSVPCKFCGGVVKITRRSNRDRFLRSEDGKRGI